MSRIRHRGGIRPSFRRGQRRYSLAICGVKLYDNSGRWRMRGRVTCLNCLRIIHARRREARRGARRDRMEQLEDYRVERKRENVMRSRFGLGPVKYEPPRSLP